MPSSIISRNIQELNKSLQKNINYIDLSYKGIETNKDGDRRATIDGGTPILNQYKMWLQSKKTDYIRKPNYGGFFSNNLNEYEFSPDSIPEIKQDLISITHKKFPDIVILDCQIECVLDKKMWKIKVMVGDESTGLIGIDYDNADVVKIETTSSIVD